MRLSFGASLVCLVGIMSSCCVASADEPQPVKPVRVLIVTGVDYVGHLWKETSPVLRKVLEQDPRIEARIVDDPEFLASPIVADYDVIVLHFYTENHMHFEREGEIRDNLANLVKAGKGLMVFHLACGSFEDWPEYANLVGKIWDRKTFHDPHGPFLIHLVDRQHPITRGLEDFETIDELYVCQVGDRPVDVLATARSKVTDKDYPMAFVFEYGKGRVFNTPLGHDARAFETPGVGQMLRRAALWTAGREP